MKDYFLVSVNNVAEKILRPHENNMHMAYSGV